MEKTATFDGDLVEAVEAMAKADRRSWRMMAELLIEEAIAKRQGDDDAIYVTPPDRPDCQ